MMKKTYGEVFRMAFDEIGAFAWTLGLNMVVLDEVELEAAGDA